MAAGLQPDLELAASLFDALSRATRRGRGIVRDSYGAGEQAAHDIARAAAEAIGLEIRIDAIGNLSMTLPGRDRPRRASSWARTSTACRRAATSTAPPASSPACAPCRRMRRGRYVPACDLTVMGIRAEESAWFDVAYLGSAGAFGLLDPACLVDRALGQRPHPRERRCRERGFDPAAIRERRRLLDPARIRAYLELHIEQGPTLVARGLPAAVVSGIRGCKRFRNARCIGEYGHSGRGRPPLPAAMRSPRPWRCCTTWRACGCDSRKAGADLVITCGELFTDAAMHGPSKIAGETRFVLDLRSLSSADHGSRSRPRRARAAARIGEAYRVRIDLGATSDSPPAVMDARLRARLMRLLEQPFEMASGAGHDAAVFAKVGIPSGMIFVRNEHGSHNPDEAMSLEDFAVGRAPCWACSRTSPSESICRRSSL